jgi:ubiquinone/menaquinone biosynthesis C-methylase UbiE
MSNEESDRARISWNPKNVFTGTAWFYARYRPDYPEKVIQLLRKVFGLGKKSRVLDLGCGTGQIALKLAPYVSRVIALDPQEDMLKEGKELASIRKTDNITWLLGEAENIERLASKIGALDITVIARAFHWMDRPKTLRDLYRITKPGGGIAIIGDTGPIYQPQIPWIKIIDETVRHWLGEERKAGTEGTFSRLPKRHEEIIKESEFQNFKSYDVRLTRKWTVEQITGYLYSASLTSLPVLGKKKELFEADLRKRLTEFEPTGQFKEPANINILIARKPTSKKH